MAIIGTLPNQILNGQLVDAPPLMADLNFIVSQVNANVPALIPASSNTVQFVTTVGGTGNAITLTPSIAITAYAAGQSFRFIATADLLGGGATVNVSGLGAQALQNALAQPLTGGEMKTGGIYDIAYSGTAFQLVNDAQGSGVVSWTPTISFGGASVGATYGTQVGLFYKIGNLCFYSCDLRLTSKGVSAGGVQIEGMPVLSSGGVTCNGGVVVAVANVTFGNAVQLGVGVAASSTAIQIFKSTSAGAIANLQNTDVANNSEFFLAGFYTS